LPALDVPFSRMMVPVVMTLLVATCRSTA
jgi:hypothetical protein